MQISALERARDRLLTYNIPVAIMGQHNALLRGDHAMGCDE